jgi:hypothetical protein
MKSINKMAVVAALALSSVGVASATTYHVTGSTAFRAADVSAEVAVIGAANAQAVYWGSSLSGASISVVQSSDGSTKFENHFTGSIAGVQAVQNTANLTVSFPTGTGTETPTGPLTAANTGSLTPASGGLGFTTTGAAPANTETVVADIAFSDVAKATCEAVIKNAAAPANAAGTTVTFKTVGIVPFVFVANATTDLYSRLSTLNVTPQNFTYTYVNGGSPLSIFTGLPGDETSTVTPLGRDIDSGTRADALAETGYNLGGSGTAAVVQAVSQSYPLDGSGNIIGNVSGAGVIAAFETVPEETVDGIDLLAGNGGYSSGGNLATALSYQFNGGTGSVIIGYLGVSDATSALNVTASSTREPAVLLSYGGVKFDPTSTASTNLNKIYEGAYTYWSTESIVYTSVGAPIAFSTTEGTSHNTLHYFLTTGQLDQLASDGIIQGNLHVSRSGGDGSNIQ